MVSFCKCKWACLCLCVWGTWTCFHLICSSVLVYLSSLASLYPLIHHVMWHRLIFLSFMHLSVLPAFVHFTIHQSSACLLSYLCCSLKAHHMKLYLSWISHLDHPVCFLSSKSGSYSNKDTIGHTMKWMDSRYSHISSSHSWVKGRPNYEMGRCTGATSALMCTGRWTESWGGRQFFTWTLRLQSNPHLWWRGWRSGWKNETVAEKRLSVLSLRDRLRRTDLKWAATIIITSYAVICHCTEQLIWKSDSQTSLQVIRFKQLKAITLITQFDSSRAQTWPHRNTNYNRVINTTAEPNHKTRAIRWIYWKAN